MSYSFNRDLRVVNVWGNRFKLPQLTHESFLTIDHSCKTFFWYLLNWTSTNLWCVELYVTYSTTHQRSSVEVQFGRYQKNTLQSKSSHVLVVAAWNVFPIHSLIVSTGPLVSKRDKFFECEQFWIFWGQRGCWSHWGYHYGNTGCGVFKRGYKIRKIFA